MADEGNVIHIRVAGSEEPGAFYLILRKGGAFGGGGSITYSIDRIVLVESSKGDGVFFRGEYMQGGQPHTVCMFPLTANFEVVRKSQTDRLTEVEAATRQKDINKLIDEVLGEEEPPTSIIPQHGQYL